MTNRERCSERVSSVSVGRCAMSMVLLLQILRRPPYDAVRGVVLAPAGICPPAGAVVPLQGPTAGPLPGAAASATGREDGIFLRWGQGAFCLLGVELDDQLLLDRRVDDLPGRDAVD